MFNFDAINAYAEFRHREFQREAELDRLANLASGPGRPIRAWIADRLYHFAEWVEGQPQPAINLAEYLGTENMR